ncbi:MAG: HAD-IA family hydrolase [Spirochaetales bacterium]|nr:HAD-IA family hydrolase [Spirochaetales bacterium]
MEKVDTIIFDAGGVLIYIEETRDSILRRLLKSSGYEEMTTTNALSILPEFDREYFKHNDEIINWKDEKEWWKRRCDKIAEIIDPNSEELKDKLFCLALDSFQYKLYEETIEILEILKGKYELVILSNATATLDWCFDLLDIRKYFKAVIISSYEKCVKPDVEIYKITLKKICRKPEQCIFIDDRRSNVETAEKLGMKGFLLKREKGENLYTFIKALE